jgi:hypothetical protein
MAISTAQADAITPSYAITDLGSGGITATTANGSTIALDVGSLASSDPANQQLAAEANGSQITGISNGQATYSFPLTPATALQPYQGIMVDIPLTEQAPVGAGATFGNPRNAYSDAVAPALMNASGIVATIDSVGVYGHTGWNSIYYVQRNPDGTWGSPVAMWRGPVEWQQGPVVGGASITGINKLNQVLGWLQPPDSGDPNHQAVLYDIKTHSLINLATYLMSQSQSYFDVRPIAIDDQGRILLRTGYIDGHQTGFSYGPDHTVLLTPDGVSSDPIPLATPEPGSLAVMTLAMAAFAVHRARERRRRGL